MCGIGGVVRMSNKPITLAQCNLLLLGNEHRGNDASGIALSQEDGSVQIHKIDDGAWAFVNSKEYLAFMTENLKPTTWGALLHTRLATQGSPRKNANNHPISAGVSCIVHNGCISNEDTLFKTLDVKPSCETDSDILRAFTDKYGITPKAIKEMNKISGSAAGGVFDPRSPKKMLLFRSGSPMILSSTEDYFMFASEKGTLYRAMKPYIKRFGIWFQTERADLSFAPMLDNTAWIVGEGGQEFHAEFKTVGHTFSDPVRRTYENHDNRKSRWDSEQRRNAHSNSTGTTIESKILSVADVRNAANEVKVKDKDAWCAKCRRPFAIPMNDKPQDYICTKKKGGCGGDLTDPPSPKVN